MSKNIGRGVLAAAAAGAMALTLGAPAMAAVDDPDQGINVSVPPEYVSKAEVLRIADSTRILTAVEASESRTWGRKLSSNTVTTLKWSCSVDSFWLNDLPVNFYPGDWELGDVFYPTMDWTGAQVSCEVVVDESTTTWSGKVDIIVAREDDYPDAISAAPLADVLNAPILLHPTNLINGELHPAVQAEIQRLANYYPGNIHVTVHLLGGTNALSHGVENKIDVIPGVDRTLRYQGVDRFQTAANIARVTVDEYGLESGADGNDVNVYLTTGHDFADALSAGAAAANNDGVVLLTAGEELDRRGITDQFLMDLETWVNDDRWDINTSEIFAVGGPSTRAAAAFDIRLADSFWGADRYETAVAAAEGVFDLSPIGRDNFAVVSGHTFADALVASGFIANLDGPLLLTNPLSLTDVTADYIEENVEDGDRVITFGGPDALRVAVTNEIKALLAAKFAVDPEIL